MHGLSPSEGRGARLILPILLSVAAALPMVVIHPMAGLAVPLALAAAVFIAAKPLRGFLLFCLLAPALPWSTVSVGVRITLSEALLALTWVGLGIQWLQGRRAAWPRGKPEQALTRLLLWSIVPLIAGQFVAQGEGVGPVNWVRWILNLSVVFMLPLVVRTWRDRERVLLCLMLGFALLLLISLAVFLQGRDARLMIPLLRVLQYSHPEYIEVVFQADYTRMASPWVHPNSTGGAFLLAAPLAAFYAVAHQGWRRALGVLVSLGSAAGIVFCGSRGALLCLGVCALWLAVKRTPYMARGLIMAAALATGLLLLYPPAQQRFASLLSSNDVSTDVRLQEYAHFPGSAARYPFGLGFKAETPVSSPETGEYGISNLWLNYWFKLGLPGMLLFIAVTWLWWKEVRLPSPFRPVGPRNAMRIGTTATVLGALATGFIDHYFSFTQVLIALFWLMVALGLLEARGDLAPATEAAAATKTGSA